MDEINNPSKKHLIDTSKKQLSDTSKKQLSDTSKKPLNKLVISLVILLVILISSLVFIIVNKEIKKQRDAEIARLAEIERAKAYAEMVRLSILYEKAKAGDEQALLEWNKVNQDRLNAAEINRQMTAEQAINAANEAIRLRELADNAILLASLDANNQSLSEEAQRLIDEALAAELAARNAADAERTAYRLLNNELQNTFEEIERRRAAWLVTKLELAEAERIRLQNEAEAEAARRLRDAPIPLANQWDLINDTDRLEYIPPASSRSDGVTTPVSGLGYADEDVNARGFRRGWYNIDGTGYNNFCRYIWGNPKPYLSCTKGPLNTGNNQYAEYHYSTSGMDQGYPNTSGMFKLPRSNKVAFCRGVGNNVSNPTMACIPIVNDRFDSATQYSLMGSVGSAADY